MAEGQGTITRRKSTGSKGILLPYLSILDALSLNLIDYILRTHSLGHFSHASPFFNPPPIPPYFRHIASTDPLSHNFNVQRSLRRGYDFGKMSYLSANLNVLGSQYPRTLR